MKDEVQLRLDSLRELLREGSIGTQEELCEALKRNRLKVTQATISRDLRRLGAIKEIKSDGTTVYRLPGTETAALPMNASSRLKDLILTIKDNGYLVVIRTPPGSASLVAHHLDAIHLTGVLGTIAGDDTVFIAPASRNDIGSIKNKLSEELEHKTN